MIFSDDKILTSAALTDRAVLCRGVVLNGVSTGVAVCMARSNQTGDGTFVPESVYFNTLQNTSTPHSLYKSVAGVITLLGNESASLVVGGHYALKLSCTGSTIKSFRGNSYNSTVDTIPKITVTDTAISSGKFGIDNGYRTFIVKNLTYNTYLFSLYLTARLQPAGSPTAKPTGYAEVPIIGSGTIEDPYRADIDGAHSSVIPTDANGRPLGRKAVVRLYDRVKHSQELSFEDAVKLAKKLDPKLERFDFTNPESGWR